MIERLINIDHDCLLAINGWNAPWADSLMWIVSGKWTWLPLYAVLIGLIVWRYRKEKGRRRWLMIGISLVAFAIAVGGADMICHTIKHAVCRLRPTHHPLLAGLVHVVNGYTGGLYGFVSSHAANTMACAMLFSLMWCHDDGQNTTPMRPLIIVLLTLWVMINCYSRMYLGVHYPADIVGGLCVGAVTAWVAFALFRLVEHLLKADEQHLRDSVASAQQPDEDNGTKC